MSRYIDADELRCERTDFDTYKDYCLMFDEIDNTQTANVRENVHGEWIIQEVCPPEYHGKHFCSKCGAQALNEGYKEHLSNFCPHCGTDMRGEQNVE